MTARIAAVTFTLAAAAAVFGLVAYLSGESPFIVAKTLVTGGATSKYGLIETTVKAIPILLCAIAVAVPGRLGLVNLGGEGQLVLGAIGATFVVLHMPDLGLLSLPAMGLAAIVSGALWGALPGVLRATTKANETLLSLLLNYVAQLFLLYLIHGPWKDPNSFGWPQSVGFPDHFRLEGILGTRIHGLIFLALGACFVLAFIGRSTASGMTSRIIESNPATARYLGLKVSGYFTAAFLVAGAIAALAGMGEVAGVQGRLRDGLSLGYGYAGFFVAWMCGNRFTLLPVGAFLFALIVTGADSLQVDKGMPFSTVYLLQGLAFLALMAVPSVTRRFENFTAKSS